MTLVAPTQTPRFPKGEGYGAKIDNRWVRLAPTPEVPVRIYTRDSLAPRRDDLGSVYDNTLDIGHVFSRGDCSGGEGLDWFPRFISQLQDEEERDLIRYWDSDFLDVRRPVRGELARITLSRAIEEWRTQVDVADMCSTDEHLILVYGTTLERWNDWDAVSPQNSATASATILAVEASPQGDIMVLLNTGALEYLPAGSTTFAAVPNVTGVTNLWWAKRRFIVEATPASTRGLYEVDSAGWVQFDPATPTVGIPFDILGPSEAHSLVSSGPAVVAACSDGTVRTYVPEQSNQLDPDSVTLVIRGVTDVPEGEIPYLLGSGSGVLLILTRTTGEDTNSIRLYQSEVLDARFDYIVGQIQLRREWLDTPVTIAIQQEMATSRDEINFVISEATDEWSLWRFDLVTFGLSRFNTNTHNPGTDDALALTIWDGRVGYIAEPFIFRTSKVEFEPQGYMIFPNITFGLNTDINWIATAISATGLEAAGTQIELYYSLDPNAILDRNDPSWVLADRISSSAQSEAERFLTGVTDRHLALKIEVFASEANTAAPNVNNVAVRGIQAQRDLILEIPVNVSDHIEVPGRLPVRIPGHGNIVHQQMLDLIGASVRIEVLDPPLLFRGVIDNLAQPTTFISDRGSTQIRTVLQCRGERVTEGEETEGFGDGGLGIGQLGIALLGVD